ncbi:MAG TPA: diguanylate cyclase [Burkholderiaceae bacterium]|jgi:diguanylate cyclase (GGDEF)-like protein
MTEQIEQRVSPATLSDDEKEQTFAFSLLKHLVVPTFVLDAQSKVIIWNLACERLTGISADEVIGTSDHWKAFYETPRPCLADFIVQGKAQDDHQLYLQYAEIVAANNGLYAENWCVMPKVGTQLYLAIDANPIYDKAGNLLAVIETLRDMTAQKEAQHALELLATQDAVTGIANRRRFDELLQLEWGRAMRDAKVLTLLMVDVDHFKIYNDTYGHQAGDACLKGIATTMADCIQRTVDVVARYGGEEFAVILPNAPSSGAIVVAERIRSAIERLDLSEFIAQSSNVTISIGVATMTPLQPGGFTQLIAAADAALYQAKRAGRNRVVAVDLDAGN